MLQSRHSRDKIYRVINHWLKESPPDNCGSLTQYQYLIFDGTFLHRPLSLVVLMDAKSNQIISGQYDVRENAKGELLSFFRSLIIKGLNPRSCTVDGNPQVIQVITNLWPGIVIQRCLVHIQRQGLSWCRIKPKTVMARKLRALFLQITNIHTKGERDKFLKQLISWEQKYGKTIDTQPEKGWVFSDLKRARSMLLKALPDMFHYLDNTDIPFTTNSIEGYFSRLKSHYRQHRGLSKNKRNNYFDWYFFLKPK